jgi:hypothetical protein
MYEVTSRSTSVLKVLKLPCYFFILVLELKIGFVPQKIPSKSKSSFHLLIIPRVKRKKVVTKEDQTAR